MKKLTLLFFLTVLTLFSNAQETTHEYIKTDWSTLAFGCGLGYGGGLGFSYNAFPQKNIGIFAAGGIIWDSFGYNLGIKARVFVNKQKTISPFIKMMYGTNAVFVVQTRSDLDKNFYGASYGLGVDFGFKGTSDRKAYWSICAVLPVISEDAKNYDEYVNGKIKPKEVQGREGFSFSIGYNMIFGKR